MTNFLSSSAGGPRWHQRLLAVFAPMQVTLLSTGPASSGATLRFCVVQVAGSGWIWTPGEAATWVWRSELVTLSLPEGGRGLVRTLNLAGPRRLVLPLVPTDLSWTTEVAGTGISFPPVVHCNVELVLTNWPALPDALFTPPFSPWSSWHFRPICSPAALSWTMTPLAREFASLPPIPLNRTSHGSPS